MTAIHWGVQFPPCSRLFGWKNRNLREWTRASREGLGGSFETRATENIWKGIWCWHTWKCDRYKHWSTFEYLTDLSSIVSAFHGFHGFIFSFNWFTAFTWSIHTFFAISLVSLFIGLYMLMHTLFMIPCFCLFV